MLNEAPGLALDLVGIELDANIAKSLAETFTDCEDTARAAGADLTTQVIIGDLIEFAKGVKDHSRLGDFDLVIMNPPYRKLGSGSRERRVLTLLGAECPNLYAAFLAFGVESLRPGGQLVAITPRSFANGTYFGQFRSFLLNRLALDHIHVFESRATVFAETDVLQENVIISGTRDGQRQKVVISVSNGHADQPAERALKYTRVVRPDDRHSFIRVAARDTDMQVAEAMMSLAYTLADLGLEVSTGRVVDFRAKANLREASERHSAPLIYPGNVRGGRVEWPRVLRKPQGFEVLADRDKRLLFPAGEYAVVKRFSAKEERRRVVAGVWENATAPGPVAFENHLNVFHAAGCGLDPVLTRGLGIWLNSSLVDQYFRTFSGHTQVNATDLRSLHYPSEVVLRRLGASSPEVLPDQMETDALVGEVVFSSEGEA